MRTPRTSRLAGNLLNGPCTHTFYQNMVLVVVLTVLKGDIQTAQGPYLEGHMRNILFIPRIKLPRLCLILREADIYLLMSAPLSVCLES